MLIVGCWTCLVYSTRVVREMTSRLHNKTAPVPEKVANILSVCLPVCYWTDILRFKIVIVVFFFFASLKDWSLSWCEMYDVIDSFRMEKLWKQEPKSSMIWSFSSWNGKAAWRRKERPSASSCSKREQSTTAVWPRGRWGRTGCRGTGIPLITVLWFDQCR